MQSTPDNIEFALEDVRAETEPFPHFSSSAIFGAGFDQHLLQWFESAAQWSLTKTSFYTQYEFSLIGLELPDELKYLNSAPTLSYLSGEFERHFGKQLKVVEITAHKLVSGHRMGVHNDFIGKDETHRLVIQLNRDWTEQNGGYLVLFNSADSADVAKIIRPLNNTGIGFEISPKSYHAVSQVHHFNRYTLVYTFNERS